MFAMEVARVFDIKRVLIFLPWIFLAITLSIVHNTAAYRRATAYSTSALVLIGWVGIVSGRHYATTNL